VHGQFYDLMNIFAINGLPSVANPYLFNGDFVDRGSFSVEVVLTLLMFKVHNNNENELSSEQKTNVRLSNHAALGLRSERATTDDDTEKQQQLDRSSRNRFGS
jgi:hypothetical protein